MPDGNLWGYLLLLLVLIGINAFFAMSELAVVSLNDNKIKRMAQEGNRTARILEGMLRDPSKFLATIQVGVTLSGLLASAVAADTFAEYLVYLLRGVPVSPAIIRGVSLVLITIILSFFTLVFGELIPKRIAMSRYEKISFAIARPLNWIYRFEKPFVAFLSWSTNSILRLFGIRSQDEPEEVTEEEIRMMVDVGNESGAIDEDEKEMINNIFEFDDSTVGEVMTHRTDMVSIEEKTPLQAIVELALREGYSRIPVYREDIDDIVGILYVKDLLRVLSSGQGGDQFQIENFLRNALYVPEASPCREVFRTLKSKRIQMAVVVDEYGGTAGLVTMEDLLESIVGDMQDEYDNEPEEIQKVSEREYRIDGATSMKEIERYFDIKMEEDSDYDTIGGYIIEQLGHFPNPQEHPLVRLGNLALQVLDMEERRVGTVRAAVLPKRDEEAPRASDGE